MSKSMSCNPSKNQIILYRKNRSIKYLMLLMILSSSLIFIQSFESANTIIEIRINDGIDLSIKDDIIIEGVNSSGVFENRTLTNINYSIVQVAFIFSQKDFLIGQLTPYEKMVLYYHPRPAKYFSSEINQAQQRRELLYQYVIGGYTNNSFFQERVLQFRVPRGVIFNYMQMLIQSNVYDIYLNVNNSETFNFPNNFYIQKSILGIPNQNVSELITDYNKMVININDVVFNQSSFETIQYFDSLDLSEAEKVKFNDVPKVPDLYIDLNVSKGGFLEDSFDSSIK